MLLLVTLFAVTHWPNSDSSSCQLGVIGVSDGTLVDITFPRLLPGRTALQVGYDTKVYSNGDTLSLVVDRYSTIQLQSTGKLLLLVVMLCLMFCQLVMMSSMTLNHVQIK